MDGSVSVSTGRELAGDADDCTAMKMSSNLSSVESRIPIDAHKDARMEVERQVRGVSGKYIIVYSTD